ncbi:MAG: hypothetical protein ACUVTL_10990 [Thermoproteota archaeon]
MNACSCRIALLTLPSVCWNCAHFIAKDFEKVKHTFELRKKEDVTLNIDYRQSWLGGASCGPVILPKYQIKPEPAHFCFRIRPLSSGGPSSIELSKQRVRELG